MAYVLKKVGKTPNIPYKHFNCDTAADLADIDLYLVPMGSTCRVISTGEIYMLNGQGSWVKQVVNGTGGGSSSGGGNGGITPGGDGEGSGDGIWDGGDLDDLLG